MPARSPQISLFGDPSPAPSKPSVIEDEDIDFGPPVALIERAAPLRPLPHEQAVIDRKSARKAPPKARKASKYLPTECKCGAPITSVENKFCPQCGTKLNLPGSMRAIHVEPYDAADAEMIEQVVAAVKAKKKLSPYQRKKAKYDRVLPGGLVADCALLAVDCASRKTGWTYLLRGTCIAGGVLRKNDDLRAICRLVHENELGLQSVVVVEEPYERTRGREQVKEDGFVLFSARNVSRSLNQRVGRWIVAWTETGRPGSGTRIVKTTQPVWASYIDGLPSNAKREVREPIEVVIAQRISGMPLVGDHATSFLLGQWGMRCGEVLKVIPPSQRRIWRP